MSVDIFLQVEYCARVLRYPLLLTKALHLLASHSNFGTSVDSLR
jgi:hypothetical protein